MSRRHRGSATPISLFAFQDIISCVMGIMLLLTLIMSLQVAVGGALQTSPEMRRLMMSMQEEATRLEEAIAGTEASVSIQTSLLKSGALLDSKLLSESTTKIQKDVENAEGELKRLSLLKAASERDLLDTQAEWQQRSEHASRIKQLSNENNNLKAEIVKLNNGQRVIYNAHDSQSRNCWVIELSNPSDIKASVIGSNHNISVFNDVNTLIYWLQARALSGDSFMLLIKPDAASVFDAVTETLNQLKSSYGFDLLHQDTIVIVHDKGNQ